MTNENEQNLEEEEVIVMEEKIEKSHPAEASRDIKKVEGKEESNPEKESLSIFHLITTEDSCSYMRLSSAHPYVDEKSLPIGEEYVIDTENKTITFPGENEPSEIHNVMVREYPSSHKGLFCIDWVRKNGFGQYAISFLKLKN